MTGLIAIALVQAAAACHHLQTGVQHACGKAVFKCLMKVPDFPEIFLDPATFDQFLKSLQPAGGKIVCLKRLVRGLGRELTGL
jgi:hypothetical protein